MGKTKNRTEKMKREIEELKQQVTQLQEENQALKRSLQQPDTTFVFGRAAQSSPLSFTTLSTSPVSAGNAAPFGTGNMAPLFRIPSTNPEPFPGLSNSFSCVAPFNSPFTFSGGSVSPSECTTQLLGSSFSFGAVQIEANAGPPLGSERTDQSFTSLSVQRDPRRWRRLNKESIRKKEVEVPSTDQVSSSFSSDDDEHSEDDTFVDMIEGKDDDSGCVETDVAEMGVVPMAEGKAIGEDKMVVLEVNDEIAEPKVGEKMASSELDCSCNVDFESIEMEVQSGITVDGVCIDAQNAAIDGVFQVGDTHAEELPNGLADGITLDVEKLAVGAHTKPEAYNNEQVAALGELDNIVRVSESLKEPVDKLEVEKELERVYAMLVDKEDVHKELEKMKTVVSKIEAENISQRKQINLLQQKTNEQKRMLDALKEEAERKLETAQKEYKAILMEREEVGNQLVEMHNVMNELQQENKSQVDEIHKTQKKANKLQRIKFWPVASSLVVLAATSVAYLLRRR